MRLAHPSAGGRFTRCTIDDIREQLTGKTLACWCPLHAKDGGRAPCHADVLLRLANPGIKWTPESDSA